uniref:Transposase n=1 Tax=Acrobeloides nanus TaxID=290746 RepID=A0A914DS13_9BILA
MDSLSWLIDAEKPDVVVMKKVDEKAKIRHSLFVYGEGFITAATAQNWYAKFKDNKFELTNAQRSGRPVIFDEERLKKLLYDNPRQSSRDLADQLGYDHQTVLNHLHALGKVPKLGSWVPYHLSEENMNLRVTICASLLVRHRKAQQQHRSFLNRIVTGYEKWCLYVNIKQKKHGLTKVKKLHIE